VSFFERIVEAGWTEEELALLRASAADEEWHREGRGAPYPGREGDPEEEDG